VPGRASLYQAILTLLNPNRASLIVGAHGSTYAIISHNMHALTYYMRLGTGDMERGTPRMQIMTFN